MRHPLIMNLLVTLCASDCSTSPLKMYTSSVSSRLLDCTMMCKDYQMFGLLVRFFPKYCTQKNHRPTERQFNNKLRRDTNPRFTLSHNHSEVYEQERRGRGNDIKERAGGVRLCMYEEGQHLVVFRRKGRGKIRRQKIGFATASRST